MERQILTIVLLCSITIVFACSAFAATRGDFDGDGKADFGVLGYNRQSNGDDHYYWYILNSADQSYSITHWGYNKGSDPERDIGFHDDFDGDGKSDIGVWRTVLSSNSFPTYFFILRSSDNTMLAVQWGLSDDIPVPQDYDGDGLADIAVARRDPFRGTIWYVLGSQRGYFAVLNPRVGTPVRGDYDGDGLADYAVTSSDNQNRLYFHILKSSTNQVEVTQFGGGHPQMATSLSVPGDYDGDGKTDIALWYGIGENFSGLWLWIRSSDGAWGGMQFGTGIALGDDAVQGDYDGDGTTDVAIYRHNQSTTQPSYFYVMGSQRGFFVVQWGNGMHVPIL